MNSVLIRLFGIVSGAVSLAAVCLLGMTAAAAAVTSAAQGVVGGVVGMSSLVALLLGVAFVASKTGY